MSWLTRKRSQPAVNVEQADPIDDLDAAVAGLASSLDADVVRAAAALGRLGDHAVVPVLGARLVEPDTSPYVAANLIEVLGVLGDPRGTGPILDYLDRAWPDLVELRQDRFESIIATCTTALEALAEAGGDDRARAFAAVWRNQWREVVALAEQAVPALRARVGRAVAVNDITELDRLVPRLGQLRCDGLIESIVTAADHDAEVDLCVLALLEIPGAAAIEAIGRLPLTMLGSHVHEATLVRHFEDRGRVAAAPGEATEVSALRELLKAAEERPGRQLETCVRQALAAAGEQVVDDPLDMLVKALRRGGVQTDSDTLRSRLATVLGESPAMDVDQVREHVVATLERGEPHQVSAALDLLPDLPGEATVEEAQAMLDLATREGPDGAEHGIAGKAAALVAKLPARVVFEARLQRDPPSAVDQLLRLMFTSTGAGWHDAPEQVLGAWADRLVAAAGYDLVDSEDRIDPTEPGGGEHETVYYYSTEAGDAAVDWFCRSTLPVSSNVLHLVALKPDVQVVSVSPTFGEDSFRELSFADQRARAVAELARRGDPPYDVAAYRTLPPATAEKAEEPEPVDADPTTVSRPRPQVIAMVDELVECRYLTFDSVRREGTLTLIPLFSSEDLDSAWRGLVRLGAELVTDSAEPTTEPVRLRGADGELELYVRHDLTPVTPA